ncbi:hypothetical protein JCM8097_009442 [Rhodosporidiobolus ruineniae]
MYRFFRSAAPSKPAFSAFLASTPEEFARCQAIRRAVFVVEQGGLEVGKVVDPKDAESDNFLLVHTATDGSAIDAGTVRWHAPLSKLGRCAVLPPFRSKGCGRLLCEAVEAHLRHRRGKSAETWKGAGEAQLVATAQLPAVGFYERMGWTAVGEEFMEVGSLHRKVVKTIPLDPMQ